MASIRSRVNGLRITIPNDARGIVHRFAIMGGGNELVFDAMSKKVHEESTKADSKPVDMGSPADVEANKTEPLPEGLSLNLADDDNPAKPAPKSRRAEDDDDVI